MADSRPPIVVTNYLMEEHAEAVIGQPCPAPDCGGTLTRTDAQNPVARCSLCNYRIFKVRREEADNG